jgi:CubicO group peptidase (beta-lactamase class C family)
MRRLAMIVGAAALASLSPAQENFNKAAIDNYIRAYVDSGNLSGVVIVAKKQKIVFEKSYGFADRQHRVPNTASTQFHVASLSMQFTAAAVLRLIDAGPLQLDQNVAAFAPGIEGANRISIRDLLAERSGLPDINTLPDYEDILQHHQTPGSLVARINGLSLLFQPGSKHLHEEHSAYNLLALIVEKTTGVPFSVAMERLVFLPIGLTSSGVDDDSITTASRMATGYEPEGVYGIKPATLIHWSAKTGNASIFTTARDEARLVTELFQGHLLSESSRELLTSSSPRVGFGWFRGQDKRFGETAYYMNGRAPGFSSFVLYLPDSQTTVVVLSNIYSSASTTIGNDVAALSLGLPYKPFVVMKPAPSGSELETCAGSFQFGPDFYQPNAVITLIADGSGLRFEWPSGSISPLIPLSPDHFIDRSYWVEVSIQRDASGKPVSLSYDHLLGKSASPPR